MKKKIVKKKVKPISLIFPFGDKKKQKIKRKKMIKVHTDYTAFEIDRMDDDHVQNLYEHGSVAEREIAGTILKSRKDWDTIVNKGLDDPLPTGSGIQATGAPTAPLSGAGSGAI